MHRVVGLRLHHRRVAGGAVSPAARHMRAVGGLLAVVLGLGAVFLNSPAPVAVALYAFLHPFAEVAGLGKLLDTVPFKQYGSCQNDNGDPLSGSYVCFIYGGKQLEGQQSLFLSGGYPVVGFGLTALFLVLWIQLKGKNRQYWAIAYWMMAIATFLSGMDSAALYLFALAAPRLLLAHAVVSVVSYTVTALLVVTIGWAGGPGLIDLIRWFPSGDGLPFLVILGVVFAAVFDDEVDEGTVEFGGVFVPVGAVEDFGVSQDGVEGVGVFFAKEFESGGEEIMEFHEGFFELVLVGESGRVAVPVSECFGVVGAEDFPGVVE